MASAPGCCCWRPSRRQSCSRSRIASGPPAQRRRSATAPPSAPIGPTISATGPLRCTRAGCRYIACPSAASGCTHDSRQHRTCPRKCPCPDLWAGAAVRSPWPGWKWRGSVRTAFAVGAPWRSFTSARAGRPSRRCCVTAACSLPDPMSRTLSSWLTSR